MLAQANELAADAAELTRATDGKLTDHLAAILAARYAAVIAGWNGEPTDEFRAKLRPLRELCEDIFKLRRGDHSGARLFMEQERLEQEREKTKEELFELFRQWGNNQAICDCLCANWRSPEEREHLLRKILGFETEGPGPPNGPANPNPDDPDQTKSG
jgi:hypothetical protein